MRENTFEALTSDMKVKDTKKMVSLLQVLLI